MSEPMDVGIKVKIEADDSDKESVPNDDESGNADYSSKETNRIVQEPLDGENSNTVFIKEEELDMGDDGAMNEEEDGNDLPEPRDDEQNVEIFQCFYCTFTCRATELLAAHINRKHQVVPPIEDTASSNGASLGGFAARDTSTVAGNLKETFFCTECQFASTNRRRYLNHYEKVHMQVVMFSCEFCDFKCLSERKRNLHLEEV